MAVGKGDEPDQASMRCVDRDGLAMRQLARLGGPLRKRKKTLIRLKLEEGLPVQAEVLLRSGETELGR